MKNSSSLLGSSGMAMGLTAATIAIAVILLSSNFTIINAQSQQQVTGQTGEEDDNGTTTTTAGATTFQSTDDDSFSVQVPQGWIIQDVNNTGPALSEEMTLGYAILAQLCPEEQQRAVPSNASISTTSCQGAQDVIHIIRYPDLDTRLLANNITTNNNMTTIDNILMYHLQKLQDVGYLRMQPVNITDVTLNLRNPETNEIVTTEPAMLVEMRYSTGVSPDETRAGYFILTATDATAPNVGTTKGYSVFYEGNTTSTTTAAEITTAAASLPPPPSIAQLFDSFELIAAPEIAQVDETAEGGDEDEDEDGNGAEDEDEDGNGGDGNGGDGNGGDGNGGDGNGGDGNGGDGNGGDGGDDDGGEGNEGEGGGGGEGNEGEGGGGGEGNPNEFDDCIVPPGRDPGDIGC
jgi:hypothetical protein